MTEYRQEKDALGTVRVPAGRYWGAATQRSLENFPIGDDRMPASLIRAFGLQKKAAAAANLKLGMLDSRLAEAIMTAAGEVADGLLMEHFPLVVWQTGSGTQTNMNVNEVIANRANEILGKPLGQKTPVHPNDHVNLSQSTNDSFPTAMHLAIAADVSHRLIPAAECLHQALAHKATAFADLIKIGRTHLQDAVPLTLGQEFSAWAAQIAQNLVRLRAVLPELARIAQGATAVGTGLNAPAGFAKVFCAELSALSGLPAVPADNLFAAIAAHDSLVDCSAALNTLAVSLTKIAGDIRLLASGPRSGLGELILPANEPGSSFMPGKVNPTQAEALIMVAARVFGNHVTVTVAGAGGQLQLNACKPVIADTILQSVRLLADAMQSFAQRCVLGIMADRRRLGALVGRSLMLVSALVPHIGYDAAAAIARLADDQGLDLRQAALATGQVSAEQFDRWVRPEEMT